MAACAADAVQDGELLREVISSSAWPAMPPSAELSCALESSLLLLVERACARCRVLAAGC